MASDDTCDRSGAAGRPLSSVPTGREVEAGGPLGSSRPLGEVTSPWLAKRLGETTNEQMARIRRTCRWCGQEFLAIERIELARHERHHADVEESSCSG